MEVGGGLGQPRSAGWVEPPLKDVALNDGRAGDLTLQPALRGGSDVDEHSPCLKRDVCCSRVQTLQPRAGCRQQIVDGKGRCGSHQSVPERSWETT